VGATDWLDEHMGLGLGLDEHMGLGLGLDEHMWVPRKRHATCCDYYCEFPCFFADDIRTFGGCFVSKLIPARRDVALLRHRVCAPVGHGDIPRVSHVLRIKHAADR
jgi:hypothetical protein